VWDMTDFQFHYEFGNVAFLTLQSLSITSANWARTGLSLAMRQKES